MSLLPSGRSAAPLAQGAALCVILAMAGGAHAASLTMFDLQPRTGGTANAMREFAPQGQSAPQSPGETEQGADPSAVEFSAVAPPDGAINTREAELDQIFSQASFGANPIDIRFNPVVQIVAPELVQVTTSAEMSALFALNDPLYGPGGAVNRTISLYFVDRIDYCGGFNKGVVGCGKTPGNAIAVEAGYADGSYGAELLAHEIAHNLNLFHAGKAPTYSRTANLMAARLNHNTSLDALQASQILGLGIFEGNGPSPLIQGALGAQFISISPYLVTDSLISVPDGGVGGGAVSQVPIPGAGLLLVSAIAGLAGLRGRRRGSAT